MKKLTRDNIHLINNDDSKIVIDQRGKGDINSK